MEYIDTKQKIILAAIKEFSLKGKAGARVDAIASEAGVNKAMLYYYYSSKDILFQESLRNIFSLIIEKQRYFVDRKGPLKQKMRIMVSKIVDMLQERPEFIRLLMHELLSEEQNLAKIAQEFSPDMSIPDFTGIAPMLSEGVTNKELRGSDIIHISLNVISLCFFPALFLPFIKIMWNVPEIDEEQFFNNRISYITDLLENGLFT